MILIVGGAYQGKLDYALDLTGYRREEFADGADCDLEEIYSAKGVFHFHLYVKRCLEAGKDCSTLAQEIGEKNPGLVIVSNELGYGIVPCEPFDRLWRETTGRVCAGLAKMSGMVCRVVCGVGMILKNDSEN